MNAGQVLDALEGRHIKDLFAREVCCGPSGSGRLDAWAMPRSWSRFATSGYEVKVSRQDWTGDTKLETYRDYVHRLWVVCPWKLIAPEEVSTCCGLLWVTKTGSRVVTKKKAPVGEPEKWELPMLSLLINRAEIHSERFGGPPKRTREEILRDWVEGEAHRWELSRAVGEKFRAVISENDRLKLKANDLERMQQSIQEAGHSSLCEMLQAATPQNGDLRTAAFDHASKLRKLAQALEREAR